MSSLVTLTTDFEERDPHVAEVKGVLYSRCPGVQLADLGHAIPRNHIMEASLFLFSVIAYFPEGTIHIVSVASGETPIAVQICGQMVICPNNGLITILQHRYGIDEARIISNPECIVEHPGQTYFGRDVFAPTAAMLASGGAFEDVGETTEDIKLLNFPSPKKDGGKTISGVVVLVNRFGSLITNIHLSDLESREVSLVEAVGFPIHGISSSYSDVEQGLPLALFGSNGFLEIAYRGDRADKRLNAKGGNKIELTLA